MTMNSEESANALSCSGAMLPFPQGSDGSSMDVSQLGLHSLSKSALGSSTCKDGSMRDLLWQSVTRGSGLENISKQFEMTGASQLLGGASRNVDNRSANGNGPQCDRYLRRDSGVAEAESEGASETSQLAAQREIAFANCLHQKSVENNNTNKPLEIADELIAFQKKNRASNNVRDVCVNHGNGVVLHRRMLDFGTVKNGAYKEMTFMVENVNPEERCVKVVCKPLPPFYCDFASFTVLGNNRSARRVRVKCGDVTDAASCRRTFHSCLVMEEEQSRNMLSIAMTVTVTE